MLKLQKINMFFVFFVVFEIIQLSFFFYKFSDNQPTLSPDINRFVSTCINSSNSINCINSVNSVNSINTIGCKKCDEVQTKGVVKTPSSCSGNGFWDVKRDRCACDYQYIGDDCHIFASYKAKEDLDRENEFTMYYSKNGWGNAESRSGDGSTVLWTAALREFLVKMVDKYQLKSMLDMPCGDFNWMKLVQYPEGFEYVGADVVKEEIKVNREKYTTPNRHFVNRDMVILPPYKEFDVIFSRDALQHLGTKDVMQAIKNWEASGAKYLITTFYTQDINNKDIGPGDYRSINLMYPPYNFVDPLDSVVDMPAAKTPHPTKNMGIWKLPIERRTVEKKL